MCQQSLSGASIDDLMMLVATEHCTLLSDQDAFHAEVSILKACRNKNIVAYVADYVDDERTWLIMEYMEVWLLVDNSMA